MLSANHSFFPLVRHALLNGCMLMVCGLNTYSSDVYAGFICYTAASLMYLSIGDNI